MSGKRRNHECPPWCHRCPVLKGDIMPACMGTAQPGADLRSCTCDRRSTWVTQLKDAEAAVQRAQAEALSLRKDLAALREDHERLERYARSRWGVLPWDNVRPRTTPDVRPFVPKDGPA